MNSYRKLLSAASLALLALAASAQDGIRDAYREFRNPEDSTRTKLWWFHGETATTREGITADLKAFKEAGVGGVVYYDQVHGSGEGALDAFSPEWWEMLKFSASEAMRLGLTFEVTTSNGFVAGGPWITEEHSMQRVICSERMISGGAISGFRMEMPKMGWFKDIAVLAVPIDRRDHQDIHIMHAGVVMKIGEGFVPRSITYTAPKARKSRVGAMQVPDGPSEEFYGMAYVAPDPAGTLECSSNGKNWHKVCDLPTPGGTSGLAQRTVAFTHDGKARYYRVVSDVEIKDICLSSAPRTDLWEIKAGYFPDFYDGDDTPEYGIAIDPSKVVDLTGSMDEEGYVRWNVPKGDWLVVRFAAESTGGKIKHGRANLMGLECSKLSVEAAELQWNSYTGRILDTLRRAGTPALGVVMDSHEAGPQNWGPGFEEYFLEKNGYSIRPWLFAMRGHIVGDRRQTDKFLKDLRRTLADCSAERYFATFDRLCREAGVQFTGQASGNGLTMIADNVSAKKGVMKPQGEFWARDIHGSLDIRDCASASHVYGQKFASGEAFTDAKYSDSPATLKMLADYSYASLINEFVVCASAYQPDLYEFPGNVANGRQYCLNRNNTIWPLSRPFWDYQARCAGLLRKGEPVVDVLVYLGNDAPLKSLSYKLPVIAEGYNYDAASASALDGAVVYGGELVLPSGMRYRQLAIPRNTFLSESEKARIEALEKAGLPVFRAASIEDVCKPGFAPDLAFKSAGKIDDCVHFGHRRLADADVYFIYNHSPRAFKDTVALRSPYSRIYGMDPLDGNAYELADNQEFVLELSPDQSLFLVASDQELGASRVRRSELPPLRLDEDWTISFDPDRGGPRAPITFNKFFDWTESSDPAVKYYSGTAVYKTIFNFVDSEPDDVRHFLHLDGNPWMARVTLNGVEVGTIWSAPWEIDVTDSLKEGVNELRIEVVNSLYNRMIGDAQPTTTRVYTTSSYPLVSASDALVPSGILGADIR